MRKIRCWLDARMKSFGFQEPVLRYPFKEIISCDETDTILDRDIRMSFSQALATYEVPTMSKARVRQSAENFN